MFPSPVLILVQADDAEDLPQEVEEKLEDLTAPHAQHIPYRRGAQIGRVRCLSFLLKRILSFLLKGSFGSVFRAIDVVQGSLYAIKRVRFSGKSIERQLQEVSREVRIMRALRHNNIVELLDCRIASHSALEIVMPYVPGTQ